MTDDKELSISDATLIARLRESQSYEWQDAIWETRIVAADRIEQLAVTNEQLVATNEALTKERDEADDLAKAAFADGASNNIRLAETSYRIKTLTAKLATCEKYRDAYDEMGRIGTQAVRDLEAKLAKAVALLIEASTDLTAYVDADYPPESCVRYPDIARRHHRDLELVRRIDATLAAVTETHKIKGESHD